MSSIPESSIKRLEIIAMRLENVHRKNRNTITTDMEWLVQELRKAYLKIEELEK